MKVTLSIDDEIMRQAKRRAEAMGTNVNQLVREYLVQFAGKNDPNADAAAFERLSRAAQGNSGGRKFNRETLHERKGIGKGLS
jgi:antitoxin component of RelBE/YafQ-DinJ toxin-antitoxin module